MPSTLPANWSLSFPPYSAVSGNVTFLTTFETMNLFLPCNSCCGHSPHLIHLFLNSCNFLHCILSFKSFCNVTNLSDSSLPNKRSSVKSNFNNLEKIPTEPGVPKDPVTRATTRMVKDIFVLWLQRDRRFRVSLLRNVANELVFLFSENENCGISASE